MEAPGHGGPRARRQGGFTLVELLVTLGVTVIGLLGLLSLHVATSRGNRVAAQSAEATALAQRALEELRARPIDPQNADDPGDPSVVARHGALPIVDQLLGTQIGRADVPYELRLSARELSQMSEDLVLLRVEARWTEDGSDPGTADAADVHRVSLELIRTRLERL